MTYRITDIKVRSLLSLNQKPSLCIVTMILSVYFCAINWKVSLRPSLIPEQKPESAPRLSSPAELRILVDIRMSNGVHISQKNLSYEGLKSLVEKLEVLC